MMATVLLGGDEFSRRLAGVERNGDQPFGENRQIERNPPDAIWSNERAALPLRKAGSTQKRARGRDLSKQFRSGRCPISTRGKRSQ